MDFKPHEQRVIQERNDLNEKIQKLDDFIERNDLFKELPSRDQELMTSQYNVMLQYVRILNERIGRFVKS